MEIEEALNLKLKAMDMDESEMPLIHCGVEDNRDDLDNMDSEDEDVEDVEDDEDDEDVEDVEDEEDEDDWGPKEPERQVYEVEAKLLNDGSLVKFPINYSYATEVADIKKQVAQLFGLKQDSFSLIYIDADQDRIFMETRENLLDALSVVDSSASSSGLASNHNVLRLFIVPNSTIWPSS